MYAEAAWILVSSGTHVQPQMILDPDYLPDYLSVSYKYGVIQSPYLLADEKRQKRKCARSILM